MKRVYIRNVWNQMFNHDLIRYPQVVVLTFCCSVRLCFFLFFFQNESERCLSLSLSDRRVECMKYWGEKHSACPKVRQYRGWWNLHFHFCFGNCCCIFFSFASACFAIFIAWFIAIPASYAMPIFRARRSCSCVSRSCSCRLALLLAFPFFEPCLLFLLPLYLSVFSNCLDKTGSIGTPTLLYMEFHTLELPDPCTAPATLTLVSSDFVVLNVLSFGAYALTLLFMLSFFWVLQGWWSMSRFSLVMNGR